MIRATSITDASLCHEGRGSGWAAWVRVDGWNVPIQRSGWFKDRPTDINYAEMMAALNGVWLAANVGQASAVLIRTDSMATIQAASGVHRTYGPWWQAELTRHGLGSLTITTKHVKGHTREIDRASWVNRWCDKMAGRAMKEQRR